MHGDAGQLGAQLFDVPFTAHNAFKGCERGAVCQVEQGVLPHREFVEEVDGVAVAACLQFGLCGGFAAFVEDAFEDAVPCAGGVHVYPP